MQIKDLCKKAHENARQKGFWDDEISFEVAASNDLEQNHEPIFNAFMTQRLMLIVTELGEAVEALRNGDHENFEEEIADTFIRLADFCGGYDIDVEKAIKEKMKINEKRAKKHGKEF